jgi:hypothetical protein
LVAVAGGENLSDCELPTHPERVEDAGNVRFVFDGGGTALKQRRPTSGAGHPTARSAPVDARNSGADQLGDGELETAKLGIPSAVLADVGWLKSCEHGSGAGTDEERARR